MLTTKPYLRIRRPSPTAAEFTVSTLPPLTPALRISLYAVYLVRMLLSGLILLFLYALWVDQPSFSPSPTSSSTSSSSSGSGSNVSRNRNDNNNNILHPSSHLQQLLHALLSSPPGLLARHLASKVLSSSSSTTTTTSLTSTSTSRNYLIAIVVLCLAALYTLTRRLYTEESLLVLRGLGIQTSSSKGSILAGPGTTTTRFIPTDKIRDVLINEAFRGFGVRYYLVVVVEADDQNEGQQGQQGQNVVVVFPKLLPKLDVVETVWRGVRECLYETKTKTRGEEKGKGKGRLDGG